MKSIVFITLASIHLSYCKYDLIVNKNNNLCDRYETTNYMQINFKKLNLQELVLRLENIR